MKKLRVLNRGKVEKCKSVLNRGAKTRSMPKCQREQNLYSTEVPKLGPRPSAKENKTCTQPRCQKKKRVDGQQITMLDAFLANRESAKRIA